MNWTEQELASFQRRQTQYSAKAPVSPALQKAIDQANNKLPAPLEDQEQEALIIWLQQRGIRHFAIPNGGHRHKSVAGKLKAQGVVSGVQDLIVMPPTSSTLPILFLELKRQRGGQISQPQQDWADYIEALSSTHPVRQAICKGCMEAIKFIQSEGY